MPLDDELPHEPPGVSRRKLLSLAASSSMASGLIASYGMLAALAARFLYPTQRGTVWLFVTDVESIARGTSFPFESPTGARIAITRPKEPSSNDDHSSGFLALSSVCPHLGCRVHWQSNTSSYFCPCHNGQFDAQGKPTAGPPRQAGQSLSRYALRVEQGLLFIELPINTVGSKPEQFIERRARPTSSVAHPVDTRRV